MADPVSSSDVPEAAVQIPVSDADNPEPPKKPLPPGLRPYKRVDMPTAEQMASEEFMNNCAVRTVLSAVMGGGLGAMFGLFMGTMDGAVRLSSGGVRAGGLWPGGAVLLAAGGEDPRTRPAIEAPLHAGMTSSHSAAPARTCAGWLGQACGLRGGIGAEPLCRHVLARVLASTAGWRPRTRSRLCGRC